MASGIDPKVSAAARKMAGLSLQSIADDYLSRGRLKSRTEADYRAYMRRYFADWALRPIVSITADMVERRHGELAARHGGAQADVAMRFLRAIFNFAEGKYQRENGDPLVASNPTKRLSALKLWSRPPRRERYIEESQIGVWISAVDKAATLDAKTNPYANSLRVYLLFLLFTGLRKSEALSMALINVLTRIQVFGSRAHSRCRTIWDSTI